MSHIAALSAVAFSPDGRALCSGSTDGAVHLWDTASGAHLTCHDQHDRAILDLVFAPDGRLFAASRDGTISEWGERGAAKIHRRHAAGVYALVTDDAGITSCSHDRTIVIGGLALRGHRDTVTGVIRSGVSLISGSRDGTLKRWDAATGREHTSCVAHDRWVTKLRAAGPHACVTVSEDGTIACWDSTSLALRWKQAVHPTRPPVWGLDVSRDGLLAISGGPTGAQLWRVADGGLLRALPVPPLANRACAFSPDGHLVACGCDDGSLSVYETSTGKRRWHDPGNAPGILSAVARQDRRRIAIGRVDGSIEVRDDSTALRRTFRDHKRFVYLMRPLDDRRFVSGAFDGRLNVCSYDDAPVVSLNHARGFVFGAAVCRSAGLVVSCGGDAARVWKLGDGTLVAELAIESDGVHNFVSADDAATRIVTGNEAGVLDVWRRDGERFVRSHSLDIALGTDLLCALTQTANGTLLAGTAGGDVVVADPDGGVIARHAALEDWIRELRVASTGEAIALCQDTTFELLRVDNGDRVETSLPKTRTAAVAFLDDGAFAAIGLDGAVRWREPIPPTTRAGI